MTLIVLGRAMGVNGRRSNIEIMADMLRVGENGAGRTEIMYSAQVVRDGR